MKMPLYSVRDVKSGFSSPFYAANDNIALRQFTGLVNSPGNYVYDFPEDFSLYFVGCLSSDDGVLIADDIPVFLHDAISLKGKVIASVEEVPSDETH